MVVLLIEVVSTLLVRAAHAQQQQKETDGRYRELVIFHVAPPTGDNRVVGSSIALM